MLDESPVAPDIQGLCAVADGEDGLVQAECILEEELVDGCPAGVGLAALGDAIFAISLWVDVIAAAGEQYSLYSGEQPGHAILALVQGH